MDNVTFWGDSQPSSDKDDIKPIRLRRRIAEYSDGTSANDGPYTEWYAPPGHQKMEEGEYVEGIRQGKWTLWHENGKVRRVENFSNGKLEGSWKQYRDDGTLESEQSYRNNLRDGKWVAYDSTGKHIDAQVEYKAGAQEGVWTYYYTGDDAKKLVEMEKLTKDQANALVEKRQRKLEQHFKDGKPEGDMISWYPNGQIERTAHYKEGRMDGDDVVYNEKGEETRRSHWSRGQFVSPKVAPPN
jgi:antitoxin component YwqK of YwqJK toxin-antitoxin module